MLRLVCFVRCRFTAKRIASYGKRIKKAIECKWKKQRQALATQWVDVVVCVEPIVAKQHVCGYRFIAYKIIRRTVILKKRNEQLKWIDMARCVSVLSVDDARTGIDIGKLSYKHTETGIQCVTHHLPPLAGLLRHDSSIHLGRTLKLDTVRVFYSLLFLVFSSHGNILKWLNNNFGKHCIE